MKRILVLLLAAALCLTASGCSSLLETEFLSVELYEDEMPVKDGSAAVVRSYPGLKTAILSLVEDHQAEGTLEFSGYSGDVAEDLPRACSEVQASNALCAYAVDYISYDLSRIVSYYEARIYINFKRTAEQLDQVRNIGSVVNAGPVLREAMQAGETGLAIRATGASLAAEEIRELVRDAYYAAPLDCLCLPETTVSIYPDSGVTRIYEIGLDYGREPGEISTRLAALKRAASELWARVPESDGSLAASVAAELLAERCTWTQSSGGDGDTAYGALVEGAASGEGFAMAYKAVCDLLGLDCIVVSGRLDRAAHAWNIVCLDGSYYHVDVSQLSLSGYAAILRSDGEMWDRYWWDTERYPACEGTTATGTVEEPSGAPAAGDAAESGTETGPAPTAAPESGDGAEGPVGA